jgi:signal transduction histidine kinase
MAPGRRPGFHRMSPRPGRANIDLAMSATVTHRLARQREGRLLAGVCVGVARSLRLHPGVVRFGVLLLTLAGGLGAVAYLIAWAVLPLDDEPMPASPTALIDNLAALAIIVGAVLVLRGVGLWFTDGLAIVGGLAAAGLALVWGRAGGPDELMEGTSPLRIAVGVLLVATGFVVFVALTGDFATLGRSLLGALVAAAGLVLLLGPRLARLAGDLADERRARIRSEERAEIATHLHDGVLQTLALIQRRAGDEREVAALARRQERELREWLYGGGRTRSEGLSDAGLASELAFELGEVEDVHRVRVELVCVGDAPLDEGVAALVAAAREASTNAARHAGVEQVDVYVEVGDELIEAFVRDRGTGFDPEAVPDDRRGLAESVIGRMQRAGGSALVRAMPGAGTEVTLRLPRRRP